MIHICAFCKAFYKGPINAVRTKHRKNCNAVQVILVNDSVMITNHDTVIESCGIGKSKIGKSLKVGKSRIKSEKSDLISY